MSIASTLEIKFFNEDKATIFYSTKNVGDDAFQSELSHLAFYVLRQMTNLADKGKHIANYLSDVRDNFLILRINVEKIKIKLEVVDSPSGSGGKRFNSYFSLSDSKGLEYKHSMDGFGFFGGRIGYYSPISVFVFVMYLTRKNLRNVAQLKKIAYVLTACGSAYLRGEVSITNQHEYAMRIVMEAMAKDLLETSEEKVFELPGRILQGVFSLEELDYIFNNEKQRNKYFPKYGEEPKSKKWSKMSGGKYKDNKNIPEDASAYHETIYFFIDRIKKGYELSANKEMTFLENQQLEMHLRVRYRVLKNQYGGELKNLISKWIDSLNICFELENKIAKADEMNEKLVLVNLYNKVLNANLVTNMVFNINDIPRENKTEIPIYLYVAGLWFLKFFGKNKN